MSIPSLMARAASDYFVYDGTPSYDFKCLVFPREIDTMPARSFETMPLPGRSGDILLNGCRAENLPHSYDCIIYEDFDKNYADLRDFLLSRSGYCRLTDTFHTDEYYHAYFSGSVTPEIYRDHTIGKFTLDFIRKPQRWLKSGDDPITVRSNGSWISSGNVTNTSRYPCYPLLYFWGESVASGFSVSLGDTSSATTTNGTTMTLANVTANASLLNTYGLYIDLETLQAYNSRSAEAHGGSGTTTDLRSYNSFLTYAVGASCKYPYRLAPGINDFYAPNISNVTLLTVKPRWYRL